jgi:hypothetical protein
MLDKLLLLLLGLRRLIAAVCEPRLFFFRKVMDLGLAFQNIFCDTALLWVFEQDDFTNSFVARGAKTLTCE